MTHRSGGVRAANRSYTDPVGSRWRRFARAGTTGGSELRRATLRRLRTSYDWRAQLAQARADYVDRPLPVLLTTITGAVDFPAIVPMLTGFLSRVGQPERILVVDDGTLSAAERSCIESISPLVEFHVPTVDPGLPSAKEMRDYAAEYAMGKKLALLVELTTHGERPVLYIDTDVWVTTNSGAFIDLLTADVTTPWFMEDEAPDSLDSRVLPEPLPHVNSGFLVLPPHLDWHEALRDLRDLIADPEWFTEQTVVHRAIHANRARTLPREWFLLRWDDRYSALDRADRPGVAVRHYVTPVRHKYWVKVHGGYARCLRAMARDLVTRPDGATVAAEPASGDGLDRIAS